MKSRITTNNSCKFDGSTSLTIDPERSRRVDKNSWKFVPKGFTLLEALLTIILMVTGFVLLLQALATGLFAGGENETELMAINLAQEKMEELRNNNYSNIINEAKAAVPGFPVFQREVIVTTPQVALKEVSVSVYWFTKADELNVSLVTYVSDI